jgi:hypothetical protein
MINIYQKYKLMILVTALSLYALKANCASAAVIINNGSGRKSAQLNSNVDNSDSLIKRSQIGDDFTLNSDFNITNILWSGRFPPQSQGLATENFSLRFFKISNQTPENNPFINLNLDNVERTRTREGNFGSTFNYSASFTPFSLTTGQYLISIVNNTANPKVNWQWAASSENSSSFGFFARTSDNEPWRNSKSYEVSFTLLGEPIPTTSIPEPSSLLGISIFSISFLLKKKKK